MNSNRRKLVMGLGGLGGIIALSTTSVARTLIDTPSQTAGPFYPVELPLDDDNDLTMVKGRKGSAKGVISDFSGKIVDINGNALSGMRIEIWQCDANGRYRHPRENSRRPMDKNFQGHGLTRTNEQGHYRFRTIRPVQYPGRTPHIHVAVFPQGERPFITQLYVAGEERNDTDFLYNRIPSEKRKLVTSEFKPITSNGATLQANFDIVLNRRDGTPQDVNV